MMDNASYHRVKEEKLIMSWRKQISVIASKEMLLEHDMPSLRSQFKYVYDKNVVNEMAKEHRKLELCLPTYHCTLNPIMLIWAQVKNYVTRINRTFNIKDVKHLLLEAMQTVEKLRKIYY